MAFLLSCPQICLFLAVCVSEQNFIIDIGSIIVSISFPFIALRLEFMTTISLTATIVMVILSKHRAKMMI